MIVAHVRKFHRYVVFGLLIVLNCTIVAISQDKTDAGPASASRRPLLKATAKSGHVETVNNPAAARPIQPTPILKVVPQSDASGVDLERQLQLAELISNAAERSNYLPEARIQHFDWFISQYSHLITGWTGVIEDLSETPQGTRVRMKVSVTMPTSYYVPGYTTETFLVKNKVVQPVSIIPSDPGLPKVVIRN